MGYVASNVRMIVNARLADWEVDFVYVEVLFRNFLGEIKENTEHSISVVGVWTEIPTLVLPNMKRYC
jgi:hypothetical protein